MLAVLRQRHFALLWVGGLISGLGDGALRLTLPFYVYVRTGSVLATGAMFVVPLLPSLLLGSLAGVFVDRWDRRRTMIAADLTRAMLILLLLAVQSRDWLWLVYAVGFLEAALSQFFRPATSALVPRLVGEGHLQAANSVVAVSDGLIGVVGPAVGGLLLGLLGLPSVVLADSASYLLSGLLIALIRVPAEPAAGLEAPASPAVPPPATTAAWIVVWREWLDGLRLMTTERAIAVL